MILLEVPVDLCLGHEDGDVPGQGIVVVVDVPLHALVVALVASLLDLKIKERYVRSSTMKDAINL